MEHHPFVATSLTRTNVLRQRQVGSSAGAAPPCKGIEGALRSAQMGQKPIVEGKAKSRPDWILTSKGSRSESWA
jgi:hypothetical protein